MRNVLVVGGGAAGLLAALSAAREGARITLLEKNEKLGKKIYITGKGRCNVTNACAPEAFQKQVVRNPRFLYAALDAFAPEDMMALLTDLGWPVMVERGERVFPQSEMASDVTRALEQECRRLGVTICLNTPVRGLALREGRVSGVRTEKGEMDADAVILCTGGLSYASTGSTGDGHRWLDEAGCQMLPARPALVPLVSPEGWVAALQGLSLKNVRLTLKRPAAKPKTLYTELGEMLFTHFGVSGPLVLSASSYWEEGATLELDLKPALTPEQLDARIVRDIGSAGKKRLGTVLDGLYPQRLSDTMAQLVGLDARKLACELTREERSRLVRTTKALPVPISGTRPLAEAIVTRGGLSVKEVAPSTMAVKCLPGLYAAGELLDLDALTGGFNLQIAFSTGFLAGRAAARADE